MQDNTEMKRSTCYQCDANCVFDIEVNQQGKAVAVHGPECPRGAVQLDVQYHPERLRYPLKRVGERGSGKFERISWDEALDTIAHNLQKNKDQHGAESCVFFSGYTKEARPHLQRLAHSFGSPNYMTEGGCCFTATWVAEKLTCGYRMKTASLVESNKTRCIVVWSCNPAASVMPFEQHHIMQKRDDRALIVVDPRRTQTAEIADIHLQIRPGTDGALALAFHHEIFKHGWQDQAFLDEWGNGVDAFREYVKDFSPEKAAEICQVSAADIRRAAEIYATSKPAQIAMSPTSTVQHSNGFQNHRAMILLPAVTGNLDIDGGNRFFFDKVKPKRIERFAELIDTLPPRIGDERFPIWTRHHPAAHSMLLADSLLEGKPYPIHAMFAVGMSTLMWPNSRRLVEGLHKLDFLACIDFFHNEATQLADIVLPAATSLEREALIAYPGCQFKGEVRYRYKALEAEGEARPDAQVVLDLGCRLGMEDLFWHGDFRAAADEQAQGLTPEVRNLAYNDPNGATVFSEIFMHEDLEDTERVYQAWGLQTLTGKVEFDSQELKEVGYDGLPVYQEPAESPIATPELAQRFPLVLTSGGRSKRYTHSQQRHVKKLVEQEPKPLVQIHPNDAAVREIVSGDTVEVSSARGAVTFYAEVTDVVKQGVVHCAHGWAEANINNLTDDAMLDPISGFPPFKSALCEVQKC